MKNKKTKRIYSKNEWGYVDPEIKTKDNRYKSSIFTDYTTDGQ